MFAFYPWNNLQKKPGIFSKQCDILHLSFLWLLLGMKWQCLGLYKGNMKKNFENHWSTAKDLNLSFIKTSSGLNINVVFSSLAFVFVLAPSVVIDAYMRHTQGRI